MFGLVLKAHDSFSGYCKKTAGDIDDFINPLFFNEKPSLDAAQRSV
jgi:hypothetical protein